MKPKKERPAALPDSIFASTGHVPEDIPVHNTFIQFGAPPSASDHKKPLLTAPAWIGPSFQSIIQQETAAHLAREAEAQPTVGSLPPEAAVDSFFAPIEGNGEPFFQPEDEDGGQEVLPLGSPQKIPMRYAHAAASSNRTSGVPDAVANVWSPPAAATVGDPSKLEGVDANGSQDSAAVPPPPSAAPPGPLPSMGSAQHAEGACKRCCFFPKGRCQNGYNCEFCHFEHEKRKRKKKKKGARKSAEGDGDESEDESDDEPGDQPQMQQASQQASSARGAGSARRAARGDERGAWQPAPIGPMRSGLPLTAPPSLPPRGLPPPTEPPPQYPIPGVPPPGMPPGMVSGLGADPFYGSLPGAFDLPGGFDLPGAGGLYAPGALGGYGGGASQWDQPGLGGVGINQSYFGAGYDPAVIAAQQQQAAYQLPPPERYLPPPR